MSIHPSKKPVKIEWKTIVFIVMIIILINFIIAFPFLIVLIVIAFFKFDLNLNKILKNFGVTDYLKQNLWGNYDKIVAEMKQSQQHKGSINKNEDSEVEEYSHEASKDQWIKRSDRIYHSSVEGRIENNRQVEEKKEEIRIKEKNKSVLKEKLSHKKVVTKYTQDVNKKSDILSNKHWNKLITNDHSESHKFASDFARKSQNKSTSKNYFWNTKQTTSFGNGKSIWDNYESITDKFSSNNK
jgi:hypothetical protein